VNILGFIPQILHYLKGVSSLTSLHYQSGRKTSIIISHFPPTFSDVFLISSKTFCYVAENPKPFFWWSRHHRDRGYGWLVLDYVSWRSTNVLSSVNGFKVVVLLNIGCVCSYQSVNQCEYELKSPFSYLQIHHQHRGRYHKKSDHYTVYISNTWRKNL